MPQEEEIMAIKVSENGRLFTLQTKDSSYQMFADDKNANAGTKLNGCWMMKRLLPKWQRPSYMPHAPH